jgi:hypothetical protein
MTALEQLQASHVLEDLPRLAQAMGCRPTWLEIPP